MPETIIPNSPNQPNLPKVYTQPKIIYELELESRAGSPLSLPNPLDQLPGFDKDD